MKWVKHDTDANQDAKLQNVLLDYGLEGYGLYWYCIELIAGKIDKDNITFELEHDARIIARNTGSSAAKVEEMMKAFVKYGLFESSQGAITCMKLAMRLDKSMTSNPDMRGIIHQLRGGEKTPLRLDKQRKSHDSVMIKSETVMQDKTRLDKNRNKSIVGQAQRCLDLLNELAGTKFKHVDSNIDLLKARFKEGYTEQEVIEVIKSKCNEWVNTDGSQYLRPATLFGKQKFSQYHGQSHIAAKPQQQDLTALSNDELFKMATELKIRTQGLFRNDLITAIKGKK